MAASSRQQCLDEQQVLCLVQGSVEAQSAWAMLDHTEQCADCEILLREARFAVRSQTNSFAGDSEPRLALSPGDLVSCRYRIERILGHGGMGVVHRAFDVELQERVALKTLHPHDEEGELGVSRLKRELLFARRVAHPNVCRVLEFGKHEFNGSINYFFTMEYLEGESLARFIARQGKLSLEETLQVGRDLANGLAAIHACGVLHRDIKTSNIMLCARGETERRAVFVDFGIAQSPADNAAFGVRETPAGTPHYMAPEQARSGQVKPQADVYSLGVVLYEMLTGKLPARNSAELTSTAQESSLRAPLDELAIPTSLCDLVCACLSGDAQTRPENGQVLAESILQLSSESQGHSLPSERVARTRSLVWRATFAAVLILSATFAFGVLGPPLTEPSRPDDQPNESDKNSRPHAEEPGHEHAPASTAVPSFDPSKDAFGVPSLLQRKDEDVNPQQVMSPPRPARDQEIKPSPTAARVSPLEKSLPESNQPRGDPCSPPYYFDEQGFRVFRPECLK